MATGRRQSPHLSANALTVLRRRYLAKNLRGRVVETPAQAFWRVARNIAQAEQRYPPKTRLRDAAERFYQLMSRLDFLPNSPTLMNAGRPLQQLSACFVLPVEDSLASIFDAIKYQALIHQSGGGTGFSFSHLRPKDDRVASTSGVASGPVTFMRIFNAATDVIKQGGTRRGANMGILQIDHPDILDFISIKKAPQEMTNFNLSVAVTDAFMRALDNRRSYSLINPRTQRTVGRLSAQLVFDLLVEAAWQSGEPGLVFLDTINRANPTPRLGRIESTNPCVTADTWVQTTDGPRQVKSLIGTQFEARVNGEDYVTSHEGFFHTGTQSILRIGTSEGYTLRLTSDHKIRRVIRKTRDITHSAWCPAGDLRPGNQVILNDHRERIDWIGPYSWEEGYLLGLLVGDGVLKSDKAVLSVWMSERNGVGAVKKEGLRCAHTLPHRSDFKGWMEVSDRNESRLALAALRDLAIGCGMAPGNKAITPLIEQGSSRFYRGFLRAFFDTDGSVQGGQVKGVSVRLAQSDLPRLDAVQRMLLRLGIVSRIYVNRRPKGTVVLPDGKGGQKEYPTKSQHELVISGDNLTRFETIIGFTDSDKARKLNRFLAAYRRQFNRERFIAHVMYVESGGMEDVFDVRIPVSHAFDANGFVVHNCGEQPLLPHESCTLGSINVSHFVRGPSPTCSIDYDRLAEVIPLAVRFLDNVIDMNRYPLPSIERMTKSTRKIGLGVMGFADLLIQLSIPYDSAAALKIGQELMQFIQKHAQAASAELARARGLFPAYRGSRLEARRRRLRNATVTTIAPTGTISIIADCSPGIEPLYGVSFARTVMEDVRLFTTHPEFVRRAQQAGVYSDELIQRLATEVSIQRLLEIPEDLRRLFVTAQDISAEQHVRMQAMFQQSSDSGVSKTINLPPTATTADVATAFRLAYRLGCKGITAFRSGSRDRQVLSCSQIQYC